MPYKNNSTIMGHVGRDAEFRWNGDMCFADFSVAVKRPFKIKGEEVTDWIDVKLFGKTAENWEKWGIHKGDTILVDGSIQVDKWEDKDGNKRSRTYLAGNWIYFSKKWNGEETQNTSSASEPSAPASLSVRDDPGFEPAEMNLDFSEDTDDADIPF